MVEDIGGGGGGGGGAPNGGGGGGGGGTAVFGGGIGNDSCGLTAVNFGRFSFEQFSLDASLKSAFGKGTF